MAEREYTKLTPLRQTRGFAVFASTRSNLWLGKDHLLCVETEGYTESYRRFYFRDIQAITLRKTKRMIFLAIFFGLLTLFFSCLVLVMDENGGKFTFGIIAAVFAIPFILNFIYGPTCDCELRTAVQTEKLRSMSRVRRARKVLARIRPFIGEAQGQLMADDVLVRFQEVIGAPAATTGTTAISPTDSPEAPPFING